MANIIVDEEWLRKTLSTLQTSFIILDHLEDNGVDLWDGYVSAMVSASYELENQLERRVNDNIEAVTALQSSIEVTTEYVYLIVCGIKRRVPYRHQYSYASTRKEARQYIKDFPESDKYYWNVIKVPKV